MTNNNPLPPPKPSLLHLLFLITILTELRQAFEFSRLEINTNTSIINKLATYTIFYDRQNDPQQSPIDVTQHPLASTDTMSVVFPQEYDLSTTSGQITCTVIINSGAINSRTCTLTPGTNKLVITGAFVSDSIVYNVTLTVSNVLNPIPAMQTSEFVGTIGTDTSATGVDNYVVLSAASFQSCAVTFSPTTINSSSSMIFTITPTNSIPQSGQIVIQIPNNRWINDVSTSFVLPITSTMQCTSLTTNVLSTISCAGNPSFLTITASKLFSAAGNSAPFRFQVNSFWSPPTNQPSDAISIKSQIATGQIDNCVTYITGLTPKTITQLAITDTAGSSMIVNRVYTIKFTLTLVDTMAGTDYLTIQFPASTNMVYNGGVGGIPRYNQTTSIYDASSKIMTLYLRDITRPTNTGSQIYITLGDYTAPASTLPTDDFSIKILRNGYPLITGSAKLTAKSSTLSGSVSVTNSKVNANTTYTFSITTLDPITSTGSIKIVMPDTVNILVTSASCASVTGTNLATNPTCTISTADRSITLSNINSTSSNIGAQTLTIIISGLQNPPSTTQSATFSISTYYTSDSASLVASGTINGVTATTTTIDASQVVITPSQLIVNQNLVTYTFKVTVVNRIPVGGYFLIYVPVQIGVDIASIGGVCSINIGGSSYQTTSCTAAVSDTSYNVITFTNPFPIQINSGNYFIARISTIFTNPSSTAPVPSFKIATFWSDGSSIAQIHEALTLQMDTADAFQSIAITRDSNKNYQVTSYHFVVDQVSPYQALSLLFVGFPSNIRPVTGFVCTMTAPVSQTLGCSILTSTIKITLPAQTLPSKTKLSLTITNIRNPPSFQQPGPFTFQSKTPNNLYYYSYSTYTDPTMTNTIPTLFQKIIGVFTPTTLGSAIRLQITFDPSESGVVPSYLLLTFANSFVMSSVSCNAFDDIINGSCSAVSSNTVRIGGVFVSSQMNFSVEGFTSPNAAPTDYSALVSFDSNGNKLDQSTTNIIFIPTCTLPCKTCLTTSPTTCLTCYSIIQITPSIFYDPTQKNCYQNCLEGNYENTSNNQCTPCNTNCLTCETSATFCTSCKSTTEFKYLRIINASQQICVSSCPLGFYPDVSVDPPVCVICVDPCVNCVDEVKCLSCVGGTFLLGSDCMDSCAVGLYIENGGTNQCDPCDVSCKTCSVIVTNCTSCQAPKILYLNQCLDTCPSPLVPKANTCGSCDSPCKTCTLQSTNCTSCISTSPTPYLLQNTCYSDCPQTYYENIASGICSLCSSVAKLNCTNCSTASTCLSCDIGYVLYQSKCLDYTPAGFVNISGVAVACTGDCGTCAGTAANCTSCKTKYLTENQCLDACPTGYIGLNKLCVACQSPCRTCQTTVTNCLSCLTTLTPPQYYINNQCLTTCPNGTYPQLSTRTCPDCQSPCQYCSSLSACQTCLDGYFHEGTSCVQKCTDGYVGVNRVCVACAGNCATCENSTKLCTSCRQNTYLFQLNSSCVTSCGQGLFIDLLQKKCVYCTEPCNTCETTPTTCLSCLTGLLHQGKCIQSCPQAYFNLSGTCSQCPSKCASCQSLTKCYSCTAPYLLYNNFCISECPKSYAVIINLQCTKCSDSFCQECTSADVCTLCESDYSLLTGTCLSECPVLYQTNGTHCLQINQQILTTDTTSFPVPFSIAAIVLIIACLMSKLQFSHTYLPGAVYSLLSILQWGALVYFLYLYFTTKFSQQNMPLYVGLGALGYLYLLNFVALIGQNVVLCTDKLFRGWNEGCNKCSVAVTNIIAILINHKFRNILFCKLFTFSIFSGYLESISKFRIFNILSFMSLIHSGGAIFAASIALAYVETSTQLYYQCIDVIVVTALNAIMAFFNVLKSRDFFYERTPDGFDLNKKIKVDDQLIEKQVYPTGNDQQSQIGQFSNFMHLTASNMKSDGLASTQPLKFTNTNTNTKIKNQSFEIQQQNQYSYGSLLDQSQRQRQINNRRNINFQQQQQQQLQEQLQKIPQQKQYNQISIQAYELLNDKFDNTRPQLDFTTIQNNNNHHQQQQQYTIYFHKSDKNIQNTLQLQHSDKNLQNTIQYSDKNLQNSIQQQQYTDKNVQNSILRSDKNVQNSYRNSDKNVQNSSIERTQYSEIGIQNSIDKGPVMSNKSIQRTVRNPVDQSVQKYEVYSNQDRSVQHTVFYQEDSVQYGSSMKTKKPEMKNQSIQHQQQKKSTYSKGLMAQPSVHDQSGQKSTLSKHQLGIQDSIQHQQKSLQASPSMHNQSNQKTNQIHNRSQQMTQKSYKNQSIQQQPSISQKSVQIQNQAAYNQFTEQISPDRSSKVIFEEEEEEGNRNGEQKLKEQARDQFVVPDRKIRSYEEQLEDRIRQRQKQLQKLKRKVEHKEKNMQQRQNAMKKNKKGSYTVQIGKLYNKGQKTSSNNNSHTNQLQNQQNFNDNDKDKDKDNDNDFEIKNEKFKKPDKTRRNQLQNNVRNVRYGHDHGQPLKKQNKLVEEQNSLGAQKTLQEISVYDDEGQRHKIKVEENNYREESDDIMEYDNQNQGELIYQGSDDDNQKSKQREGQQDFIIKFQQQNPDKQPEQPHKNFQSQRSPTNRSSNKIKMNYRQSEGQITSFVEAQGKDGGSTNLYSSKLIAHPNHPNKSTKNNQKPYLNLKNIDKSLYQGQSSDINSNIFNIPQNIRSDMSGTIEQISPHLNRTAQYKSKSKDKKQKSTSKQPYPYPSTQQKINQKIKQMIPPSKNNSRNQLPKDKGDDFQMPTRKFTYNNLQTQNNSKIMPKSTSKPSHERKSSLLRAGQAQFNNNMEDRLAYKKTNKGSPLKVAKKWEYERQDKQLSDSAEEEVRNTRSNRNTNPPNINKTQQNKIAFQTDKQDNSFRNVSFLGSQKILQFEQSPKKMSISKTDRNPLIHQMQTQQIPIKPKIKLQRDYGTDAYEDQQQPYIEDESQSEDVASRYKNNILLGQMLDRPDNSDLKQYYQANNLKKSKPSHHQSNNQTQKIYMQRFDRPRR